jgi:hypothetical protein
MRKCLIGVLLFVFMFTGIAFGQSGPYILSGEVTVAATRVLNVPIGLPSQTVLIDKLKFGPVDGETFTSYSAYVLSDITGTPLSDDIEMRVAVQTSDSPYITDVDTWITSTGTSDGNHMYLHIMNQTGSAVDFFYKFWVFVYPTK